MSRVQIVDISTKYIEKLTKYLSSKGSNILPYKNKRVGQTPFTRPYVCLKYSEKFQYIECFPLTSYKHKTDDLRTPYYTFIRKNNTIRGKIVLNCKLIVPRNQTRLIMTTPKAISNAPTKALKDYLRALQDEWKFCADKFNLIMNDESKYKILLSQNPKKYKQINITDVSEFNKIFEADKRKH